MRRRNITSNTSRRIRTGIAGSGAPEFLAELPVGFYPNTRDLLRWFSGADVRPAPQSGRGYQMIIITKKAVAYFCVAAALAVCCSNAWAADHVAEVAAIHAADQVWLKGYNSGDVDIVASLYGEDAVLLPPGASSAHGRRWRLRRYGLVVWNLYGEGQIGSRRRYRKVSFCLQKEGRKVVVCSGYLEFRRTTGLGRVGRAAEQVVSAVERRPRPSG
jgi:hypothetical protein